MKYYISLTNFFQTDLHTKTTNIVQSSGPPIPKYCICALETTSIVDSRTLSILNWFANDESNLIYVGENRAGFNPKYPNIL